MSGIVDVLRDDAAWIEFLDDHGPVVAMAEIKRLLDDLGQQEQSRIQGIAAAKSDPAVPDEQYEAMKRGLAAWRRRITTVRVGANARLSQVKASATTLIDSAAADRRALVILAKRIWLWEEGLEDRLEDALDDCTISDDPEGRTRITLRELVKDMQNRGQEITP